MRNRLVNLLGRLFVCRVNFNGQLLRIRKNRVYLPLMRVAVLHIKYYVDFQVNIIYDDVTRPTLEEKRARARASRARVWCESVRECARACAGSAAAQKILLHDYTQQLFHIRFLCIRYGWSVSAPRHKSFTLCLKNFR